MGRAFFFALFFLFFSSTLLAVFLFKGGTSHVVEECSGTTNKTAHLFFDNVKLDVAIADTDVARKCGLSTKKSMPADAGMLFVFESPGFYGIWMKDMFFPLDIFWLDAGFRVVHLETNVSPDTFPQTFRPGQEALYVLEANAGVAERFGITVGSKGAVDL